MAYIGVEGMSKKIEDIYIGVDDVAKKVVKAYIGDAEGNAKLWYDGSAWNEKKKENTQK